MLGRRFLLLVAVLMGLTALAASIAPREPLVRDRRAATPSPTPTGTVTADPDGRPVEKTVETAKSPAKVTVDKGDLVRLTVQGDVLDSVQLDNEIEPINPVSPAVFELYADDPGEYPIDLVSSKRRVGTLVIRD
jgi:hypothetical protein